jgi:hypothetical protein
MKDKHEGLWENSGVSWIPKSSVLPDLRQRKLRYKKWGKKKQRCGCAKCRLTFRFDTLFNEAVSNRGHTAPMVAMTAEQRFARM